jgi:hypothetical protein
MWGYIGRREARWSEASDRKTADHTKKLASANFSAKSSVPGASHTDAGRAFFACLDARDIHSADDKLNSAKKQRSRNLLHRSAITFYHSELLDLALASTTFLRTADFFSASNISFSARFRNSSQASIDSTSVR